MKNGPALTGASGWIGNPLADPSDQPSWFDSTGQTKHVGAERFFRKHRATGGGHEGIEAQDQTLIAALTTWRAMPFDWRPRSQGGDTKVASSLA